MHIDKLFKKNRVEIMCYMIFHFLFQRIDKLKDISSNYIRNWSPNATSVAVVTFNGTADVVAPLTAVTSEQERHNLVALVDNIVARGATSIGAGIQKAIKVLIYTSKFRSLKSVWTIFNLRSLLDKYKDNHFDQIVA